MAPNKAVSDFGPVPEGPGLKICPLKWKYALRSKKYSSVPHLRLCDTDRCAWWDEERKECSRKRR